MKLTTCIIQGPNKKQMAHSKGAIQAIMLNKNTKIWAGSRTTKYGKAYLVSKIIKLQRETVFSRTQSVSPVLESFEQRNCYE